MRNQRSPFGRKSMWGRGDGIPAITGTGPVLASLVNADLLSAKVTWGSYSGTGSVTTTKQMKLNAGSWVAYVGGTVVSTGEMWTVRELVSDTLVTDQPFTSGFQIVISTALSPSQFGIGDWVVNPTMTTGSATFTIYRMPADNGSAITSMQYRIGAGAWVNFSGFVPGTYAITGFTDGVQNSITIRARNAISADPANASAAKFVTTQTSAALVSGTSATIVSGGKTWTLSSARPYGNTDTGIVTVDWTAGLSILSVSPAATTDGGQTVNGNMREPVRGVQGWHQTPGLYSAGANAGDAFAVSDGETVVGAVHQPGAYATESLVRRGVNLSYSGLYFKSGGLPVNAVAPALISWTGRGAKTSYALNLVDVAASLPAYSLTGIPYPTVAAVITQLDRLEVSLAMTEEDSPYGYEALLTQGVGDGGDGASNYGQSTGRWYGAAGLHLIGDVATAGQKQTLLKSMIRHGVQWYDNVAGDGNVPRGYGGHFQFHMIPVAMALHYLGRGTALDNMHTVFPGNPLGQCFTYDATRIANLLPHSDTSKPLASRRRTLSAVSGLNMSMATDRTGGIGDLARVNFTGMQLVRESPAATATIVSMPSGTSMAGSTVDITIDVQPGVPFANGDVVYTRSPDPIYEDDTDWRERSGEWPIIPAHAQEYREIAQFSDEVLSLRGQGIWRDAWTSVERYTAFANRSSEPSGTRDYPTHHTSAGGFNFAQGFWDTHGPTVLGSYPVVLTSVSLSGTGAVGTNLTIVPAVVAPASGLTRTYKFYNNGVEIPGEVGPVSYTVAAGDDGDKITVWETLVNAKGTQISRSAAVVGNSGYTVNAVNLDGVTSGYSSGLSGSPATTQGAIVFTFRFNATYSGDTTFQASNSGGSARVLVTQPKNTGGTPPTDQGRLIVRLTNSSSTQIGDFTTANGEFLIDTYYTVAISWDTVAQIWVARKRPNGGAWATITPATSFLTASAQTEAIARFGLGTTNGGSGRPAMDLADVWVGMNQLPDFTDSAVLAKFLPTVSKGTTGSIPTGTAPHFFFSGATASFHTNDGTAGGLALSGAFTTASAQPT